MSQDLLQIDYSYIVFLKESRLLFSKMTLQVVSETNGNGIHFFKCNLQTPKNNFI